MAPALEPRRPAEGQAHRSSASLPLYELTVSDQDLRALEADYGSNQTYPGSLRLEGKEFPSVQLRHRGQWARTWPKKPLKIFFDHDQHLHGHRSINLNSAWRDPAFLRESLAYYVFRACAVPASRSRLVELRMNGMFLGIYVEVEQVDKTFLKECGLRGATLYKSGSTNQADERDVGSEEIFAQIYSDESGKTNTMKALNGFCKELANTTNVVGFFSEHVHLENYINYLAACVLMQHWDGFNKNHFLAYDEQGSHRWTVIPWDLDRTFGDHWNQTFNRANLPILLGTHAHRGPTGWNRLEDAFFRDPTLTRRFLDRVSELLEKEFTSEKLEPVIDRWERDLGDAAALDRQTWPSPAGDTHAGILGVKRFIKDRRTFLRGAIRVLRDSGNKTSDPAHASEH